jgi:hypothetical protein
MPKFDLIKTQELADLLVVERDKRDAEWIRRFYEAVDDASMSTTADQVLQGPDGFSYFVLNMPAPRRNFEPFSVSHVLDFCLENSLGIVIDPQPEPPEWVFPFGLLWSKKQFGKFDLNFEAEPDDAAAEIRTPEIPNHLAGKQAVLVAQPNQSYFPAFARNAVRKFLLNQGIQNPGVLLLSNPAQNPLETIAFSIFPEDFADTDQFRNFMQHLAWFFPPHYRLSSVSRNSDIAKSFQPL